MRRTSTILTVLLTTIVSSPIRASPPEELPAGAVRRLGLVRQFASAQAGLVAFSADGTRLVAGAGESTIHVWDWPAVKMPRTLLSRPDWIVTCTALAPDGKTLAVGTNGAFFFRNLDTGAVDRSISIPGAVQEIAFAPDGKRFATFGTDGMIRLRHRDATPGWSVQIGDTQARCLAFAGNQLLAGCEDGNIHVWDATTGKPLPPLTTGRSVRSLAVTADGRTAFSTGANHVLLTWDVLAGEVVQTFTGHTEAVLTLACSTDGKLLASAGLEGAVRLWDVASGEEVARLNTADQTALALAFSRTGRMLVVATPDGYLDQWNLDTDAKSPLILGHREEVEAVVFGADGREIQSWSASETLRWQTATGQLLGTGSGVKPVPEKLLTSPNGKYRVAVVSDLSVFPLLVSTETGKEVELAGPLRSVRGVAFSHDDKILAAVGSDGNVTLWETISGQVLAEFKAHAGRANCIAFSPSGRLFATGGGDASILLWSLTACGSSLNESWRNPTNDDLESIWNALAADRGEEAFRAMRALVGVPKKSVPLLRSKLPPALDLHRIRQSIVQLDSDDFETREKASRRLQSMGRDAEQSLRDALASKPPAEVKRRVIELLGNLKGDDSQRVRLWSRAVFVLEQIGTPEARSVLKLLASGDRVAKATEDARAALKRR